MRTVIHEAVADLEEAQAEIVLTLRWVDGAHTEYRSPRRRGDERTSKPDEAVENVRTLALFAREDDRRRPQPQRVEDRALQPLQT